MADSSMPPVAEGQVSETPRRLEGGEASWAAAPEPPPIVLDPAVFRAGNRIEILRDGAEAYPRMLQDIRAAQKSVDLEMYIFASDLVGWRFARALAERRASGVRSRLIYDSLGSRDTVDEVFGFLSAAGVELHEYAPTFPRHWGLWRQKRDHRKMLIVDDRVAYVGGINIANEYAPLESGGGGWRDTAARVEGPVVADLCELFLSTWPGGGNPPAQPPPFPDGWEAAAMGSERRRDKRSIARHYLAAINGARRRIWITNAYFLPDGRFLRALRLARARGVDVRILLPAHSDSWPVAFASFALFTRLLRWGARIFLRQGPMMHAKTAVVDGAWSLVGSFNLDQLSLFHNLEVSLISLGRAVGARMEEMFEADSARSEEVQLGRWRSRPIMTRFVERACYALRAFL